MRISDNDSDEDGGIDDETEIAEALGMLCGDYNAWDVIAKRSFPTE
ncbi:MAG: hypothetical protein GY938_07275 [Ketobacter sp.]|nr:hypothetical protein [Ketobacter sp.]